MKFLLSLPIIWGWEGNGTPLQYSCLEKSYGWRSRVGCSPWGGKESDTTERLHFHFSLSCIGEGNGNPLQYSCLENPRDGGAWWAAVYGVTQSWTRLKWLSSSSNSSVLDDIIEFNFNFLRFDIGMVVKQETVIWGMCVLKYLWIRALESCLQLIFKRFTKKLTNYQIGKLCLQIRVNINVAKY